MQITFLLRYQFCLTPKIFSFFVNVNERGKQIFRVRLIRGSTVNQTWKKLNASYKRMCKTVYIARLGLTSCKPTFKIRHFSISSTQTKKEKQIYKKKHLNNNTHLQFVNKHQHHLKGNKAQDFKITT
uniref:Uncharacterized protein n=1 Tax=Cacopsylla melanoneura TaxID=428564 RepID=A0A8D8VX11_9HEMI